MRLFQKNSLKRFLGLGLKNTTENVPRKKEICRFRAFFFLWGGLLGLASGFCRARFWAKFAFWRGTVRDEVFGEVWGEAFGEVFVLVLLGH